MHQARNSDRKFGICKRRSIAGQKHFGIERKGLLIVLGISRWFLVEQELFRVIGLDSLQGLDRLLVIEAVRKIVGGHVTGTQIG
jgi:hypothetical protein